MSTGRTRTPATDPVLLSNDARLALVSCDEASRIFLRSAIQVPAVLPTTCTVAPGMRVALTGPSGSGKSTLLHLLAGLETPTSGTVSWPGLGGPPHDRPGVVGLVFQGPSLIPALDVVENITLPLLLAGVEERDAVEHSCAAPDRLALGGLARKRPEEISGGEAKRVAIARVLASAPPLILADEPTGQLDHATGARVLTVLLEAADELDAALIVTTHDEQAAQRFALRWRMTDGRLHTEGTS